MADASNSFLNFKIPDASKFTIVKRLCTEKINRLRFHLMLKSGQEVSIRLL